jgi:hypothetical protein
MLQGIELPPLGGEIVVGSLHCGLLVLELLIENLPLAVFRVDHRIDFLDLGLDLGLPALDLFVLLDLRKLVRRKALNLQTVGRKAERRMRFGTVGPPWATTQELRR